MAAAHSCVSRTVVQSTSPVWEPHTEHPGRMMASSKTHKHAQKEGKQRNEGKQTTKRRPCSESVCVYESLRLSCLLSNCGNLLWSSLSFTTTKVLPPSTPERGGDLLYKLNIWGVFFPFFPPFREGIPKQGGMRRGERRSLGGEITLCLQQQRA